MGLVANEQAASSRLAYRPSIGDWLYKALPFTAQVHGNPHDRLVRSVAVEMVPVKCHGQRQLGLRGLWTIATGPPQQTEYHIRICTAVALHHGSRNAATSKYMYS